MSRVWTRRAAETVEAWSERGLEQLVDDADPVADLTRDAARTQVQRALAELPPIYREVVVLRELEDLSYREISRITGVPLGTVMSRLARGRARLQQALMAHREGD